MTPTEAAWLAGIFDGEGSFMILPAPRQGFMSWSATVAVSSTDDRITARCRELAGGKLSGAVTPKGNAKLARIWTLSGKGVEGVLTAVLPFLVTKREQAAILLLLRSEIRPGALPGQNGVQAATAETRQRREAMRQAVKALNHRGTTPTPPEQTEALALIRRLLADRTASAARAVPLPAAGS